MRLSMLNIQFFKALGSIYSRLHQRFLKSFKAAVISSRHVLKSMRDGNLYLGPLQIIERISRIGSQEYKNAYTNLPRFFSKTKLDFLQWQLAFWKQGIFGSAKKLRDWRLFYFILYIARDHRSYYKQLYTWFHRAKWSEYTTSIYLSKSNTRITYVTLEILLSDKVRNRIMQSLFPCPLINMRNHVTCTGQHKHVVAEIVSCPYTN